MDRKEFFKLSQITTKLDLDPEEFLYWLGRREHYAGEEEQACAVLMDHALLRLAEEGRLDVVAALLSGDQKTFETFRCEAPELVHAPPPPLTGTRKLSGSGLPHPSHHASQRRTISQLR